MTEDKTELKFEEALNQLEEIVRNLETGRVNLDDAIGSYQNAITLKKLCEEKLKNAELVIKKLEASVDGTIKESDLDDASTS
ncbi:MAG: exodeoxyribonuclease VII small subunit [Alphaproteobacteria bacterium]